MEAVGEYGRLENQAAQQLMKRLDTLQQALRQRLTQQITDFKRFTLQQLLADVDRLMADTRAQIERDQAGNFGKAGAMGEDAALKPVQALRVQASAVPGLDAQIITATFGNAVDLLSVPMQQFSTEVKAALRRVVLAGDSKMEELQRLQRSIAGAGFDNAQYRAERIMRTEMGRVFNQATYAKLAGLAQQFPFLKKGWRATPGNRTRTGHAEAGRTYARGHGIPIAQRFVIRVFDERDKKAPKQIGVAQLRFPIDPETTPAGRIAAAATILCRCNAFVDIDVAGYAAYAGKRVGALNLGAVPPGPEPEPAPRAALPAKPRKRKLKLPAAPKVVAGAPAANVPAPAVVPQKVGPAGVKVSDHIRLDRTMKGADKIEAALKALDSVHGDGVLPSIPGGKPIARWARKSQAYYAHGGGRANSLAWGPKILKNMPNMGVFHEVGHFLDHTGLGRAGFASDGIMSGFSTAEQRQAMADLMSAFQRSRTMQALRDYESRLRGAAAKPGQATLVPGTAKMASYLSSRRETFARAYAQYVAVKSGAGLQELRNLQAAGASFTNHTVPEGQGYGYYDNLGAKPSRPGWNFPWAWQDDEFGEIEQAFDRLFDAMGWRK